MSDAGRIRWHRYPEGDAVVQALLPRLREQSAGAIAARGRFDIVLSGGSTPRPVYAAATHIDTAWDRWHVWFADERCLPRGDPERNDLMVRQVWLDHVPVPDDQVHVMPAELGPEQGAAEYRRALRHAGAFDIVLLGLGEDGHTASLFPGHDPGAGPGAPDVLAVRGAPKPPPERVSLSAVRLRNARALWLLVLGDGKREAVRSLEEGADLPVRAVIPDAGLDVFLDAAAAG